MRTMFTLDEIARLRLARRAGGRMTNICAAFGYVHTRDEIVEAIDAIRRFPSNQEALHHANAVLAYQDAGIPLINGRPPRRGAAYSQAAF